MAFSPKPARHGTLAWWAGGAVHLPGGLKVPFDRLVLLFFLAIIALRLVLLPEAADAMRGPAAAGEEAERPREAAAPRKAAFHALAAEKLAKARLAPHPKSDQELMESAARRAAGEIMETAARREEAGRIVREGGVDADGEAAMLKQDTRITGAPRHRNRAQLRQTKDGWSVALGEASKGAANTVLEKANALKEDFAASVRDAEAGDGDFLPGDGGGAAKDELDEDDESDDTSLDSNLALVLGAGMSGQADRNGWTLSNVFADGTMKFTQKHGGKAIRKMQRTIAKLNHAFPPGSKDGSTVGPTPPRTHRVSSAEQIVARMNSEKAGSGSFTTSQIKADVLGKPPESFAALLRNSPGLAKLRQHGDLAMVSRDDSFTPTPESAVSFGNFHESAGESAAPPGGKRGKHGGGSPRFSLEKPNAASNSQFVAHMRAMDRANANANA